jgi:polyisoprenyl-teichoic acid--peptidoglycan teichoic acid transferase
MREFQNYTITSHAVRWRRVICWLPIGLVVALMVGLGVWVGAVPTPSETLGYGPNDGSGGDRDASPPAGWLQGVLVGSREVSREPLNVLVVGLDKRPPGSKESQVYGVRTDTIMLVQIVPKTGRVELLSIPRDLLVEIEPGVEDRINAAYAYGGIEQTVITLQSYTEVPIDRYAIVDFEGFEDIINAMGMVEVDVEGKFPQAWHMENGLQRLNGHRALLYARYRGTPGGDLDRIERQQQLVAALRSKALDWDTITELPRIMRVMNENVETDLGFREALTLGRVFISQGRNAQMTSVQLEGTPTTLPSGAQVLVPNEAANEAILEEFRY